MKRRIPKEYETNIRMPGGEIRRATIKKPVTIVCQCQNCNDVRRAFEAGAKVEIKSPLSGRWLACPSPLWFPDDEYRIAEEQTHPILWWQKQAAEQRAIKEDIRNLRNAIRFWHGMGS